MLEREEGVKSIGKLLNWALSLPNPFREELSFAERLRLKEQAIDIPDGTYGITSSDSPRFSIIGTYGMYLCIAVGLYVPDIKTSAVAHFKDYNSPEEVGTILQDIFSVKTREELKREGKKVRAVMRGGQIKSPSSRLLALGLLRALKTFDIDLYGAELFKVRSISDVAGGGFAIDSRDGKIFSGTVPSISAKTSGSSSWSKLTKSFDGRPASII